MLVAMGDYVYARHDELNSSSSEHIQELVSFVRLVKRYLGKYLTLPDDQKMIIETLNDNTDGQFRFATQSIHLDSKLIDRYEFLTILCHEAVHAEQYFQNRFSHFRTSTKTYVQFLNHTYLVTADDMGLAVRPWEEEAYRREEQIARAILDDISRGE